MIRLRQVAWVAADLEAAAASVMEALDLEVCYVDPGVGAFGLENRLFCVGDQFLEIVSPVKENTTAGRFLDKRAVEAAGYMVIFQTTADLDSVRSGAEELDVRIVFEAPGGNVDDGTAIHGIHFHPADVGGAIVSIDRCDNDAEWAWAGPSWRDHVRTDVVSALTGLTIETPDPSGTATKWAQLLGADSDSADSDSADSGPAVVHVDGAEIRFVEGDRGVVGLDFAGTTSSAFDLLGADVRVSG